LENHETTDTSAPKHRPVVCAASRLVAGRIRFAAEKISR
jgi:hypothetical protein